MTKLVPAIDIIEGRCVRLSQGDYNECRRYDCLPEEMARQLADTGVSRIHVVDLDGAKASSPCNLLTLKKIRSACGSLEIEWGGGVKSDGALKDVLGAGANCAIIGSMAVKNPDFFISALASYGGGAIVLGADFKGAAVATDGWLESSSLSVRDLLNKFLPGGLSQAVVTDISRDGMLRGVDVDFYSALQEEFPAVDITVSGGISSMNDIEALAEKGLRRIIIGKAMYEGRITMKDIERWSLRG